jgi:hypothetical protein
MPPKPGIDELSRVLGGIEAQLANITKTQAEDRMASASWRTGIREDIAGIREDVAEMKGGVRSVTTEVDEIKPVIADYVEQRAQARGIGRLATAAAAIFGGGVVVFMQWLLKKIGG